MAIAMTSPSPFFRNFSNKENSTFASSPILQPAFATTTAGPSSHKHRIGGIGRAPKRSQAHNAKPYVRKSSIARAKASATLPGKAQSESTHKRTRRSAPPPILTTAPISLSRTTLQPPRPQVRIANIPIRLPRPRIPPVQFLAGEMSHIPIVWALPRLRTQFPALLAVSSQYRPQPQYTRPTDPSSSTQHTFAFAIPQLLAEGDDVAELEAKVKGREPDVCLAIKGRGREAGVARLLPVNSLVYSSQCAFWPRSDSTSLPSPEASSSTLPAISEESTESASDSDATITSAPHSSASSSSSSESDSESPATLTPSAILHLPLLSLTVPHPASLPTLHTHLHLPARPLIPSLLALPPTCLTPELTTAELSKLGLDELMQKLEHMHGFWSNLCALGISAEATWKGLGEAWALVIDVVAARSRRAGEMGGPGQ